MKTQKKRPNIVSVQLVPEAKAALDEACAARGMTIKSLLGRLIDWFTSASRSEQSIILEQVARSDLQTLAQMLRARRGPATGAKPKARAKRTVRRRHVRRK